MKKASLLLGLAALCLLSQLTPTLHAQQARSDGFAKVALPNTEVEPRVLAALLVSDVPTGLRVRINATVPLKGHASYRSGDRFIVILPQTQAATMQTEVSKRGLLNIQVEQRGDDAAVIFRLESGTTAEISEEANWLDVNLSAPQANSAAASTANVNNNAASNQTATQGGAATSSTLTSSAPASSTLSPSASASSAAATVPSNPPTTFPQLPIGGDLLKSFFGRASAEMPNIDLAIPESPAFTVLGVTPQTVTRPTSPRDFATSLLNGVDDKGNFQTGIAFDAVPYMIFAGPNLTLADYNKGGAGGFLTRLFARTQFSFATTKGASEDDKSNRLALGLHMTLFDNGDPRVHRPSRGDDDVLQCFANHLSFNGVIIPPGTTDEELATITEKLVASNNIEADKCRERARKANWNKSSWIVAVAPSWISPTGETKDYRGNGGGAWTSLAYGFEGVPGLSRSAQLIIHGRFRSNEQVADPDAEGKFLSQDSRAFGARFRVGTENTNGSLEGIYIRSRGGDKPFDTSFRMSVGFERRVNDNIWFNLAFGGESGKRDTRNNTFVITSLKWGLSRKTEGASQ
jgi:hypothetical protein